MTARFAAVLLLALCAAGRAPAAPSGGWRTIMSQHDHQRVKHWREDWVKALGLARDAGAGARVDALGALLQPDAAIDGAPPPDGPYRCRMVKLGARAADNRAFATPPSQPCRVADGMLEELGGAQRIGGRLYPDDGAHMVFLGGMALGDEEGMVRYGRDGRRDLAGFVERIGPARWRLILPAPRWESLIDIVELVPDAG